MHQATLRKWASTSLAVLALAGATAEAADREDARELLSEVEHALHATQLWPPLRTQPALADRQELRFWRLAPGSYQGLAIAQVQGRIELKRVRLGHCARLLREDGALVDQDDHCLAYLGIPGSPDGETVYKLEEQGQEAHSADLMALWYGLMRELQPEFLHPTDDCNRGFSADGHLDCIISTREILDLVEWSDGQNYFAFAPSLDESPN